jgi:hypothetical protein
LDKIIELLQKLINKVQNVEEIAIENNNLIGFMISSNTPKKITDKELKSIYLTGEFIEYIKDNNIPMDFIADA